MKKQARVRRLPWPAKILINLALLALLWWVYYLLRGCPDLTAEMAYERAARRHMIGPGEIVDILPVDDKSLYYDRLLLAETEEGIVLYCYREANLGFVTGPTFSSAEGDYCYREKGETLTVLCAPMEASVSFHRGGEFPLLVFDRVPEAVRCEMELRLENVTDKGEHYYTYQLEGERRGKGYFALPFRVSEDEQDMSEAERWTLAELGQCFNDDGWSTGDDDFTARVRLYDASGQLRHEESVALCSAGELARQARDNAN